MRRRLVVLLLVLVVLLPLTPARAQQQDDSAARTLLAALNAWRLENNLWPLAPNPTLQALAIGQAEYVLSLPAVPEGGDIHLGQRGEQPPERAEADPYDWPPYGRDDRVDVTEIAYEGASATRAITYWQGSPVHHRAALNPAYREVGVAALPSQYGRLYIVVLGSRPNILPTLLNPNDRTLYLTNETYRWAAGGPWINNASEIQIFDGDGRPLGSRQPWKATVTLPPDVGDDLYVVYSDGTKQAISAVRSSASYVLLPSTLSMVAQPASPTAATPATATALPTTVAMVAAANTPTLRAATATPASGGAPAPTRVPTVTPIPSATVAPTSAPPQLTLVYDRRSLALINTSGRPINLTGLALAQNGRTLMPIARWAEFYSGSLTTFPAGDCLQAWSASEPTDLPVAPGCRYQRSVMYLSTSPLFWTTGPFEVQLNGVTLIPCESNAGKCLFDLP